MSPYALCHAELARCLLCMRRQSREAPRVAAVSMSTADYGACRPLIVLCACVQSSQGPVDDGGLLPCHCSPDGVHEGLASRVCMALWT